MRNIIIMLGDGMGMAHRTAARLVRYGVTLGDPNGFLTIDALPATGPVSTHSLNSIVTDSAPGMACYTSGTHAKNGQEGVYPANVVNPFFYPRVEYMAEYLHRTSGKSLGIISTADLEDATPASTAVHTGNRNNGTGIINQFFDESDLDGTGKYGTGLRVLMGGGRRWFLPPRSSVPAAPSPTTTRRPPPTWRRRGECTRTPTARSIPSATSSATIVDAGFTYVNSATGLSDLMSAAGRRSGCSACSPTAT